MTSLFMIMLKILFSRHTSPYRLQQILNLSKEETNQKKCAENSDELYNYCKWYSLHVLLIILIHRTCTSNVMFIRLVISSLASAVACNLFISFYTSSTFSLHWLPYLHLTDCYEIRYCNYYTKNCFIRVCIITKVIVTVITITLNMYIADKLISSLITGIWSIPSSL